MALGAIGVKRHSIKGRAGWAAIGEESGYCVRCCSVGGDRGLAVLAPIVTVKKQR